MGTRGEHADVVVVGCGVAGAWTALFLAEAGVRRVVVLDRAQAGAGASARGTGLLRVHHANPYETDLAYRSRRFYKDWESTVGIGSCGWRETGVLWMVGAENVDRAKRNAQAQSDMGCPTRILTPEELVREWPALAPEGIGAAVHEPDGGTGIGSLAIDGLVSRLLTEGVDVRTHTPVTRILRDEHRVIGVDTRAGRISTERVVLAAGAWSAGVAHPADVQLPLTATRATLGTAYYPPAIEPAVAFFDEILDCGFAPKAGGTWATVPVRDDEFLAPVDPDDLRPPSFRAAQNGISLISRRVPALRNAVMGDRWSAADGTTPDGRPIIGEHPELPGLFLHVGGNFKGFKMAPIYARGLASQLVGSSDPDVDVSHYSLARFGSQASPPWAEAPYANSRWT